MQKEKVSICTCMFIFSLLIFTQCKKSAARAYADRVNRACPMIFDNGNATLENIKVLDNNILLHSCTVVTSDTILFGTTKEELLYAWANEPVFKPLSNEKVTGIYQYYNKETKRFIYEIKITPDLYLNYQVEAHAYNYLKATADALKSLLTFPSQMDENEYLIELNVREPAILEYKIQLVDIDVNELDTVNNAYIIDKSIFLSHLKQDVFYAKLRNFGTTFNSIVFDKNNKYIGTVSITPEDYRGF